MFNSGDSNIEIELPQTRCINTLGNALRELGMLGSSGPSISNGPIAHRQILGEIQRRPKIFRFHPSYVSDVSVGFRVRPLTPQIRYKPYPISERHRTRSENNDEDDANFVKRNVDSPVHFHYDLGQLKRAKSLESIIAEDASSSSIDLSNIAIGNSSEVEVVSNSIQNLKVVE